MALKDDFVVRPKEAPQQADHVMVLNDNKVIRLYHGPQQGPQQGTKRGFYVNFSFDNYLIPDVEPSVK